MKSWIFICFAALSSAVGFAGEITTRKAELSWNGDELVLRLQYTNPLAQTLTVHSIGSYWRTWTPGHFGSLALTLTTPDGKDRTEQIFGKGHFLPFGSFWTSPLKPGETETESFSFAENVKSMPAAGLKLKVTFIGLSDAEENSIFQPQDDKVRYWNDPPGPALKGTALIDTVIIVPAKPVR